LSVLDCSCSWLVGALNCSAVKALLLPDDTPRAEAPSEANSTLTTPAEGSLSEGKVTEQRCQQKGEHFFHEKSDELKIRVNA
jgi:hypothetical protein